MIFSGISVSRTITAAWTVLMLSACGSDTSSHAPVSEDTDLLVQNAANHASRNIGITMNSVVAMTERSTVVATINRVRKTKGTAQQKMSAKYDDNLLANMRPTLEGGNVTRTRNGNTITIDPDEQLVCQQWLRELNQSDINDCTAVFSDLTVELTATTDDSGTLRYLFGGEDLITIEYAPTSGSYEILLTGFQRMVQRVSMVTGESNDLPDIMTGAVKLSASVENATETEEAGTLALAITRPLHIESTEENYSFRLDNSTLAGITSDAATGNGKLSIAINALQVVAQGAMGSDESAITTVDLPEFTLSADVERFGTQIVLSNTGMGRGPLTVSINDNDILNVAMDKFSARYNDLTREAEFLRNFNLNVALNYSRAAFGWIGDDSAINLSASIPTGTLLTEQLNGSTQVARGGPVSYSYSSVDGSGDNDDFEQDVLYTTGQCFDEARNNDGFELVSCD